MRRFEALAVESRPKNLAAHGHGRCEQGAAVVSLPNRRWHRSTAWKEARMLKFIGWTVAIIFLIGLLVVFGVIDLVF